MAISPIRNILLADDDRIIHGVLGHFLKDEGFTLRSAFNGREVLEMAEQERPDLLILDGMMPELDGFEVLKIWQQRPHLASIPVVMLTSRKGEGDMAGAIRDGAAGYLTKPFSPDELVAKVASLTRERSQQSPPSPSPFVAVTNPTVPAAAAPFPAAAQFATAPVSGPMPTQFHGSVRLDETRAGHDAGRIAEEVISRLLALPNCEVVVTLSIEAKFAGGAPPHVINVITDNCRNFRFESRTFD